MLSSYVDLHFEFIKKADNSRYANGEVIRIVNLGPIVLFSNDKLTSSSGKQLEGLSHAHIAFLMYKLITSPKDTDNLSFGFDRNRNRKQQESTINKKTKGNYHVRIMLSGCFWICRTSRKNYIRLGFKLTITRNKDDGVLNKAEASADARNKIDHVPWYVPYYTPCNSQQDILSKNFLTKTPTELRYFEQSLVVRSR